MDSVITGISFCSVTQPLLHTSEISEWALSYRVLLLRHQTSLTSCPFVGVVTDKYLSSAILTHAGGILTI